MSEFLKKQNRAAALFGNALAAIVVSKLARGAHKNQDAAKHGTKLEEEQVELLPHEAIARAHELHERAVRSGTADDKIEALGAANVADKLNEGERLGMKILTDFISRYKAADPELHKVEPFEKVSDRSTYCWAKPEFARRHEAVKEALGVQTGVQIRQAQSSEDHLEWAKKAAAAATVATSQALIIDNAALAEEEGWLLEHYDYSVPGTYFQRDAVVALSWNEPRPGHAAIT